APVRLGSVVRLVAALVLTFAVLPYAWGRTAIIWMLVGAPEARYAVLFVLSVVAVMLVTHKLSSAFGRPWLDRWLAWGVGGGWIVLNVVLLAFSTGPLLPWWLVALPFVPA